MTDDITPDAARELVRLLLATVDSGFVMVERADVGEPGAVHPGESVIRLDATAPAGEQVAILRAALIDGLTADLVVLGEDEPTRRERIHLVPALS